MSKSLGDKIAYLPFWLVNSSILFCFLASSPTTAQIVPDATLPVNSSITPQDNITTITGGTTAGGNLFHSFEQFSVPTGGEAFFDNAPDIQNIVGRVTGSSVSNIDGLIRANGTANLFLLNPNEIIFGPKASLNIGGSFLASTASSLNFADGTQFNAPAPQTTPLLTVSVPIGLQFGSNPGAIRVQGTGHSLMLSSPIFSPFKTSNSTGLQVKPGKTLAFLGGDIALEGGTLKTAGGRIELGSVAGPSIVSLTPVDFGWALGYEGVLTFGDMQFRQRAAVDASGVGSSSIQVQGAHVKLTDGSVILIQNQGSQTGGSLSLNASESLEVNGTSSDGMIPTSLINETVRGGNGGDIGIATKKLIVQGGAGISTRTYGAAKGGDLTVNALESIQVTGFSPVSPSVFSLIVSGTFSSGSAGNTTVNTEKLTATSGGNVGSITLGKGNGGNLTANATDVELNGVAPTSISSALFASTGNTGNAGKLTVNASKVTIKDGAVISSSTAASGNSGSITINASDFVEVSGRASIPPLNTSNIVSSAAIQSSFLQQAFGLPSIPSGASGDVTINTRQLRVTDRGQVDVRNEGPGNAGTLRVNAPSIFLGNSGRLVAATTSGKGGDIILKARNLQSRQNSLITATAVGSGNGGNVTINTKILVALENSNISANALQGQGGNIQITTQGLFLSPNSEIRASSGQGPQFDGIVQVNTPDIDFTRATVQPVARPESPEIASVCQGRWNTVANELIDTGTGGVPASPSSSLSSDTGWQDNSLPNQITKNSKEKEQSTAAKPVQIVEAQGWKRNAFGTISMITDTSEVVLYSSLATPSCLKAYTIPIQEVPNGSQDTVKVQQFLFKGNKAFSTKQLEAVVAPYKKNKITFTQLLQARAAVTNFYTEAGYITSGALIPIKENQEIQSHKGAVTIQVVEGTLEKINVSGSARLQRFVRSRLEAASSPALNRERLESALRLLQTDPKIKAISANLIAGSQIGKTLLDVDVLAKQPFRVETSLDNERSPAVGSLQRRAQITQSNLLGLGDELNLGYRNTDGSDAIQTSYTLPINLRNGTLQFDYADISSDVVERPFNELDIISDSRSYELSLRQPLLQKASTTSTKEFALGVSASRQESESSLAGEPYPLSLGADDQGRTRISSVRFFQDWTQRSGREVMFARSQFSLGVGALDATINANAPDSRFFTWRGQALWLRRLAENTTLLLRADLQLADQSLVPLEQFSLGGATTVRGYRQDALLGDSGFLISAELRIPLVSSKRADFHIIPFVDMGSTWNDSNRESEITDTLNDDTLVSVGLGLQYQVGDRLNARLDWGIPLNNFQDNNNSTWQENGLHFSLRYQPSL